MIEAKPKRRWGFVVLNTLGAAVCLLAVWSALTGFDRYVSLGLFCGGIIIVYGRRRLILRVGVSRSRREIVCRYFPLYEGWTYYWCVLMPVMGFAIVAAGYAPGNPGWWRFGGIALLVICALMMWVYVRMWRRCLLCITPSTLRVRAGYSGSSAAVTEIHRDQVQAIETMRVTRGQWLQIEVAYRGTGEAAESVKIGPDGLQVSVQPMSLLNGLMVWKDGVDDDPGELLDRVERIFRDLSTAADA